MSVQPDETAITLSQAAKICPGRPSLRTAWRWAQHGVRGIKLETFMRGGRRFTTRDALNRFILATSAAVQAQMPLEISRPAVEQRERSIAHAEATCRAAGI